MLTSMLRPKAIEPGVWLFKAELAVQHIACMVTAGARSMRLLASIWLEGRGLESRRTRRTCATVMCIRSQMELP